MGMNEFFSEFDRLREQDAQKARERTGAADKIRAATITAVFEVRPMVHKYAEALRKRDIPATCEITADLDCLKFRIDHPAGGHHGLVISDGAVTPQYPAEPHRETVPDMDRRIEIHGSIDKEQFTTLLEEIIKEWREDELKPHF